MIRSGCARVWRSPRWVSITVGFGQAVATLALLGLVTPALAGPPDPKGEAGPTSPTATTPTAEQAASLKAEGDRLMADFMYADALARFEEAIAIGGSPALLYNSGRALEMLARYPEALERLRSFQTRAPADLLAKVPNLAALILDIERHTCVLTLETNRPGATVRIGEHLVGKSPLRDVRVNAQKGARVTVSLEGHDDDSQVVELPMAGRVALSIELYPKDRSALLRVDSPVMGATVSIDGVPRGQTPTELRLLAGPHTVVVGAPDHEDTTSEVSLAPGQTRTLAIKPVATRIYKRWWFWTLVGSAVAAGAGVGTWYALTTEGPPDVGSIAPGQSKVFGRGTGPSGVTIAPIPVVDVRF
ncbi:MAG: PEGA domain-containing protein [Deltaproteobacteria bacterium]|nr:PEGA domain-containing protein [Deltaproteobacteria bacterium]